MCPSTTIDAPAAPDPDASVSVIVSRHVPAVHVPAFETMLRDLMTLASRQPGHVSNEVIRGPMLPDGRDYHVVYRFADAATLTAWETAPARAEFVGRLDQLTGTPRHRRALTGLEAWFDLPSNQRPPPRYRMALLTWIAIWPLVSIALWLLTPQLATLPYLARTAITTSVVVALMTYAIMPRLSRAAGPWLRS